MQTIQEWQDFYRANFGWKTVIDGDYLLLETGPESIVALEFHQQYELYERFVKWDIECNRAIPEYHNSAYAEINGHKLLFFKFSARNIEQLTHMKTSSEFITFNGVGPLYWTLHNVEGKVPVEPSPGCKWPVAREHLAAYLRDRIKERYGSVDAVVGSFFTGTLYLRCLMLQTGVSNRSLNFINFLI